MPDPNPHQTLHRPPHKTKIVCTIGPASRDPSTLRDLMSAGLDVARINFAHGSADEHRTTARAIRDASHAVGRRVAIFGDLPGPKMRIGQIAGEPVELARGAKFVLRTEECTGDAAHAHVSFADLPRVVRAGDEIFINDGFLQLRVQAVGTSDVTCEVEVGGPLWSNKGVNFPGIDLGIRAFTERDAEWLRLAAELDLDGVSQSFVQDAADLDAVRAAARALNYDPFLIAKIERRGALDRLDEILDAADGIMVARGDLGVEIPIEEIAVAQKRIIAAANVAGVPVITATHMLESMIEHTRPTRAEATDVANAVLDGTDCLMLSGETAIGRHPVATVRMTAAIAEVVERGGVPGRAVGPLAAREAGGTISRLDRLSLACHAGIQTLRPVVVVAPTLHGAVPRRLTRFRIAPWVVAASPEERTCQRLVFSYGVIPVHVTDRPDALVPYTRGLLRRLGFEHGVVLIVLSGELIADAGAQTMHVVDLDAEG